MTIEDRLEKMERELGRVKRRNRWLLGAILLVAGGLAVPAVLETTAFRARAQVAGTAKEIRANKFVLEDENGKARGILTMGGEGPALILNDGSERARATLSIYKEGPGLALYDENSAGCVMLDVFNEGAKLRMFDQKGMPRLRLLAGKAGPALQLVDETGNLRFVAGREATQTPDGKIITYPESSLLLFGADGNVIWSAIK
jgi:hypothetical protein